jgi:hypothetical protein
VHEQILSGRDASVDWEDVFNGEFCCVDEVGERERLMMVLQATKPTMRLTSTRRWRISSRWTGKYATSETNREMDVSMLGRHKESRQGWEKRIGMTRLASATLYNTNCRRLLRVKVNLQSGTGIRKVRASA